MKPAGLRLATLVLAASFVVAMTAGACQRKAVVPQEPAPATVGPSAPGRTLYGTALAPADAVPIAKLLASPDGFRQQTVTVEGHVRKACTRKGCWMELGKGDDAASPGARITFKNYGFFVPTDSAGAQARVQGIVEVDTLTAAAVRHYEEEGAVFPGKKSDGTAPEVRLVASGVELWR